MAETNVHSPSSDPAISEKPSVPATSKPDVAQPAAASAPLYKIVRVRKPDGTIVKVKRPITVEEASKTQSAPQKPASTAGKITNGKPETKAAVTPTPASIKVNTAAKVEAQEKKEEKSTDPATVTSSEAPAKKDKQDVSEISKQPEAKKTLDETKPPETTVTSKTDQILDTTAKGARLYRGLRVLHRGSSRLIGALAPEWDINDMEEGDEELSDFSDDDDDDEEKYDSDDEKDREIQQDKTSNSIAPADAKEVVNAGVANIATLNTPRAQTTVNGQTARNTTDVAPKSKNAPQVSEKQVSGADLENGSAEKPVDTAAKGRNLKKSYTDWSRYVIWSIIILFPLLFMAVGIAVACRHKKPTNSKYEELSQALQVAISVWPIVFAGIVAQSLRAYATYKVERGVRLMTLEQLVNSNSVAASFKQPFLLRRFDWITIALLTLWGLSPLATQAMQRVSATEDLITDTSLRFVNTTDNGLNYLAADATTFEYMKAKIDRLYSVVFLDTNSAKIGADQYNNALIPSLNLSVPSDEWQTPDPSTGIFNNYVSAFGIPVAAPDQTISLANYITDTSTFKVMLTTGYLSFTCDPVKMIDYQDVSTTYNLSAGITGETSFYLSMTPMSASQNGSLAFASLITLNTTDREPVNYTLVDLESGNPNLYAYTNCNFWQTFLEANVSCQSSQCYTYAVRPTPAKDTPVQMNSGAENWLSELQTPSETIKLGNSSHLVLTSAELYLFNQTAPGTQAYGVNLTAVDHDYLVSNLALMMNTFWTIGFAPRTISVINVNGSTEVASGGNSLDPIVQPESYAHGTKTQPLGMFVTRWGWLAALILCCSILLLAGIFSIWWDARSVSPDVLGFASTVVRKSKYVQLPKVDSAASGAERARALGDVRVMMQDVKPSAEVGRIALGTAHPNAQRLMPGRSYR